MTEWKMVLIRGEGAEEYDDDDDDDDGDDEVDHHNHIPQQHAIHDRNHPRCRRSHSDSPSGQHPNLYQ